MCQNNALRAVAKEGHQSSATTLHHNPKIDWLGTMRARSSCIEIYKHYKGVGPTHLCELIKIKPHTRDLRSSSKIELILPNMNTKLVENDILYRGIKLFNLLDETTKSAPNTDSFKSRTLLL